MRRLVGLLVFLFPLAASLGPVVRVGPLAIARVVAVLLMGLAVLAVWRTRRIPVVAVWILLLWLLWLGWGFATLRPGGSGAKEILSVMLGLGASAAVVVLAGERPGQGPGTSRALLRTMTRGWLFAWLVVCLPVLWELATGRHLWNYLEGAAQWIRDSSVDVASYMVNPNLLAMFLVSAMAMMMVGWRLETGWLRHAMAAAIVASPVLCWFTNSRLVVLLMPVMLVWFCLQLDWVGRMRRLWAALALVAVLGIAFLLAPMPWGAPEPNTGSLAQRAGLYKNGWYMVWHSLGLGVGAGQFETQLAGGLAPFDIHDGPQNPHSGLFETAGQYGVGIAALALALLAAVFVMSLPVLRRRWSDPALQSMRWALVLFVPLVVPLAFANSSWLDSSVAFLQVTGIALAAHVLATNPSAPVPRWQPARRSGLAPRQRTLTRACRGSQPATR